MNPVKAKENSIPLVLASASPRRRSLLQELNVRFRVIPSDFDEVTAPKTRPDTYVKTLAAGKARAVARTCPKAVVIGADTVVVLDGELLGKPTDPADARRMLSLLSGRTHEVLTGVSLVRLADERELTAFETTRVTFGALSDELIARYVASGESLDKAGAYGIQALGATLVERIDGCCFNVVGLPLYRLARMLETFGIEIV